MSIKTHKDFIEKLHEVHKGKFLFLDVYTKWNQKSKFKCLECNNVQTIRVDSVLQGQSCKVCKKAKTKEALNIIKNTTIYKSTLENRICKIRKDINYYRIKIKAKHKHIILNSIKYSNKSTGSFKCLNCKSSFETRLDSMLNQSVGCSTCANRLKSINMRKEDKNKAINAKGYKKEWSDIAGLTKQVYRRHQNLINPTGLEWGKKYHIDHIYSIRDYWYNKDKSKHPITRLELCHPANLQMLAASINIKKGKSSWITVSKLRTNIILWNKQYGRPFRKIKGQFVLI